MTKTEEFINFVECHGASVVVTQEDDGNGYTVMEVTLPRGGAVLDVTVNEAYQNVCACPPGKCICLEIQGQVEVVQP